MGFFGGMWCSPWWAVGLAGDLSSRAAASLVQTWELSPSQQSDLSCSSTLLCLPQDLDVVSIALLRVFAVGHVSYRHFRELVPPSLGYSGIPHCHPSLSFGAFTLQQELMLFQATCGIIFLQSFCPFQVDSGVCKPLSAAQALICAPAMDLESFFAPGCFFKQT